MLDVRAISRLVGIRRRRQKAGSGSPIASISRNSRASASVEHSLAEPEAGTTSW